MNVGQTVPFSQPSAPGEKCRLRGTGAGGHCPPCHMSVSPHQAIIRTTITVVTFMIRSASSLDSCIPCVLRHQKYTVMRIATNAAVASTGSACALPDRRSRSLARPTMYCPADTPLIGPVST